MRAQRSWPANERDYHRSAPKSSVRAKEARRACRQATQRLAVAEDELSAAERNIARVREGFEATDRGLNDKARGQQEALRQAKTQHQTVEERKDPAYLNIGRHLATRGIAPPNAPHLLHDVLRHRQSLRGLAAGLRASFARADDFGAFLR